MIKRSDIQACARSMIGTPYQHQGRVPGVGLDCSGLVVAVANRLQIPVKDHQGYGRRPDGMLSKRVAESLDEKRCEDYVPQVGDVLCFVGKRFPQHLAIRTDTGMVHALADSLVVNETSLDGRWVKRLWSVFKWRVPLEDDTLALKDPGVARYALDGIRIERRRCRWCDKD